MLFSIALTGLTVAFFHAAIPTHWLPFVLASKKQQWSRLKTLAITALAGVGHIAITTFIGFLIVYFGRSLNSGVGEWFPFLAAGALILFGGYYITQFLRGRSHVHLLPSRHHHQHHMAQSPSKLAPPLKANRRLPPDFASYVDVNDLAVRRRSDRVAIVSLIALLTFSPCEGFLPVFFSGIAYGWTGFAILAAILGIGTVAGMTVFTSLTLAGMEKIKLSVLEKYEALVMGVLLCLLGVATVIIERAGG